VSYVVLFVVSFVAVGFVLVVMSSLSSRRRVACGVWRVACRRRGRCCLTVVVHFLTVFQKVLCCGGCDDRTWRSRQLA